jgi:hypothetical protein
MMIQHHRSAGGVVLRLAGAIDETLDTSRLLEGADGVVVMDLEGVSRITSYGVQAWRNALAALSVPYLGFINCHPALVSQFNMVRGFAGSGQLVSLYLPHACGQCGHEFEKLLDLRQGFVGFDGPMPPKVRCPRCGADADFDELPDSYLSYAAAQPPPAPPPAFDVLWAAARAEPPSGLKLVKEVEGRFTGLWLVGHLDQREHFTRATGELDGALMMSMEGVASFEPEGIAKAIDFLKHTRHEVVLSDVPLELADKVADEPALLEARRVKLLSLQASFRCVAHGEVRVPFDARSFIDTPPARAACPLCSQPSSAMWSAAAERSLERVPTTPLTPELYAVLRRKPPANRATGGRGLPAGVLSISGYPVVRTLGAGSTAEVFLARKSGAEGEQLVAVKRVLAGMAVDRAFVETFLEEARIASKLAHPNVVQIYQVGGEGDSPIIVMEYVAGVDLGTVIRHAARGPTPCPVPVAARIVAEMAAALHAAHLNVDEKGGPLPIIHRDVSPHNVLLSREGAVKMRDFGIAKAADVMTRTPTSALKGNMPYIAPELIRGGGPSAFTPQVDVFAAGLVLYQLLTLEHPFKRDTELATFAALAGEEAPPPSARRTGVPPELDAIVARAMAKDRAVRYADVGAFKAALESLIDRGGAAASSSEVAAWVRAAEGAETPAGATAAPQLDGPMPASSKGGSGG